MTDTETVRQVREVVEAWDADGQGAAIKLNNISAILADGAASQPNADLIQIARDIEAMKRDCGPDPESPTAIYNGQLMGISYRIRALAAVQGKK